MRIPGRRVAVLTVSGGAGALAADMISAAGLELPQLSADAQAEIRSFIPSYGATRNPVDLTAGGAQGGGGEKEGRCQEACGEMCSCHVSIMRGRGEFIR